VSVVAVRCGNRGAAARWSRLRQANCGKQILKRTEILPQILGSLPEVQVVSQRWDGGGGGRPSAALPHFRTRRARLARACTSASRLQGQTERLRQAAGAQAHSTTFEPSPELGPPRTHRLATHPRGGPGLHPKSVFSLPLLLTRLRTTQVHADCGHRLRRFFHHAAVRR
jgi:hypothetical protein